MMPATVAEVASGLRTRLATIVGLRVYDSVPDIFAPPCAFVLPSSINFWEGFAGGNVIQEFTVTAVVGRTAERTAQDTLYRFMAYEGDLSVRDAIEEDRTLGGVCQSLIVERADNIRLLSQGDQSYLAVDFSVRIHS